MNSTAKYKLIRADRPSQEFSFRAIGQVFDVEETRLVDAGKGRFGLPNPTFESQRAIGQMSPKFIAIFEKI